MKLLSGISLLFILLSTSLFANQEQSREQLAWQMILQDALIIDNRTAKEYAQGHLTNAINIPFDLAVKQFNALEIRKNRHIVLYCRSGNRSGKALKSLSQAGYTKLHNGGGYKALISAKEKQ